MTLASLSRITGASVNSAKYGGSGTPSQPLMIGESRLPPRSLVDGAGQAHPDAVDPVVAVAGVVEQRIEPLDDVGHQVVGAETGLLIDIGGRQYFAGQVAHGEPGAAAADGRGQHDAGVGVEAQERRGASAGRWRQFALDDQSLRGERRDPRGHRGAGQPGELADLGAGDVPPLPDQGIDIAGGRRR